MNKEHTDMIRSTLGEFTNRQLIQCSNELNEAILPEESIIRDLIPEGVPYVFTIIELNCLVRAEIANRLNKFIAE